MARQLRHYGRRFALLIVFCLSLGVSSSAHALGPGYLWQAIKGQMKLSNRARPIRDVLRDERVSPRVRALLARVAEIKRFAESKGLKATRNYEDYVAWDGPALVWVVSASRELAFESKTWSFPVLGSFTYLGWFDRGDAREFADALKPEGWEVDVRGAAAFSSLGYFKDPVISTMLADGDPLALAELAETVIHESVHASLYLSGQSTLNESVAQVVAESLTPLYLAEKAPELRSEYLARLTEQEKRLQSLHSVYVRLAELYASPADDVTKRARKAEILAGVKVGAGREANNAMLIQFKTYHSGWKPLTSLWSSCGADARQFLAHLDTQWKERVRGDQVADLDTALAQIPPCVSSL